MRGRKYLYATIPSKKRAAVFAIRVQDKLLDPTQTDDLAETMGAWVQRKG